MGLAYVGYYAMLSEAWVVCSVLRSAGIPAEVFDHYRGTMIWTQQTALGGFRVAVPRRDLNDALAIMKEVAPPPQATKGEGWTIGAMLLAVLCIITMPLPWMWMVLRDRPTPGRIVGTVLIVGVIAVLIVLMISSRLFWRS